MSRVELLSTLLSDLKKLCGFFHRPTKDSIAAAEAYLNKIKSNENDIDLKIVLNPFFVALEDDPKLFFQSILDSFTYIFKEQIFAKFLTKEIILKILNALRRPEKFSLTQEMTIEKYIALCGDFQKTIFLHGPFIETIIGILLRLHSISESLLPKKNIQEILIQIITTIFQEESTGLPNPSNYDSTTEYIQNLVKTIVINSEMIVDTLKPNISDDYVPTLKDSDCYSAINAFSSIIETNKLSLSTIQLSSACLIKALETKSKFFTTNIFKALLQTKIHVALITLIIDPRIELVDLTSKLFVLLWQRFAPIYNDNLNELFVRGLGTTLASPEQRTIIKSLKTFEYFTKYPQLLVDTFVNYDCDESGYYQNVFENSVSQIAKLSYPDSIQTPVQKKALNVLVSILKSLWKYFSEFRIGNSIAKEAPQGFLDAKKTKNELNIGLEIFKKSWKKGLEYFVQHNFIEDTPQSISKFLYSTPSLDPAQVGEILGNSSPKNIEILKSYMSLFNFKNQTFEQSFRTFLSSFQIPGEGQMIDRIMEQFGRKYYDDNPQYFSCADTVYVLAYSTLMLHTDAHHPSVKSRMTLDQFIANNRGIDNGKDLSYDFLKDLYQGICSKKIFTTSTLTSTNSSLLTRKQKAEMFKTRCKETLENARQRTITSTTMNAHEFHKSESPLLIGPMFDSIWGCVLGSLTITFSQSQQKEIYTKCLKGLTYAVHIASHCFVENALDTLVDSFAQFTGLRKLKYTEVQQKNIDCTNALIKFSIEDGNFLRNAWQIVMEELSAIERLKQTQNYSNMFIEADTLFSNSATQLDHESIIDFIQAICDASLNELKQNPPMTTLFIDLSRVLNLNINREHITWKKIWDIVSNYLQITSCKFNLDVSHLSIDLLYQLASQFLSKKESVQYHFQEHFLIPFKNIFENNPNPEILTQVIVCINRIIMNNFDNLQSGWKIIFEVLLISSTNQYTKNQCFDSFEFLMKNDLNKIKSYLPQICKLAVLLSTYSTKSIEEFKVIMNYVTLENANTIIDTLKMICSYTLTDNIELAKVLYDTILVILDKFIILEPNEEFINIFFYKILFVLFGGVKTENVNLLITFIQNLTFNIIEKNWGFIQKYCSYIFKFFMKCFENPFESFSSYSFKTYLQMIDNVYPNMTKEQMEIHVQSLSDLINEFSQISINNAFTFIKSLKKFVEMSKKFDDISKDYIKLELKIDEICENNNKLLELQGFLRVIIIKSMIILQMNENIIKIIFSTLKKYLNNDEKMNKWNKYIVKILNILNGFDDDLFMKCFDDIKVSIIEAIACKPSEIRKEIRATLERKLSINKK